MKRKFLIAFALILTLCFIFSSCDTKEDEQEGKQNDNKYPQYQYVNNLEEGINWPDGQVMPTFATPEKEIDTFSLSGYSTDEQLLLVTLQGLINVKKPRILLYDTASDEGPTTWAKTEIVGLSPNVIKKDERFEVLKEYIKEISGAVVLYNITPDAEKYPAGKDDSAYKKDLEIYLHYRNVASTIAGIKRAIPMNQKLYDLYTENGIELNVVEDITALRHEKPLDIYNYLYDNYWKDCSKRLLVSLSPKDAHHVRDMAAATGAAVVFLDCANGTSEQALYEKFLKDMPAGNSVVLGWYMEERSGITTATKYGLSTVPADLYMSSTVYAGTDHKIQVPAVPNKPELKDKVYIALYISDGDNIQYNQRYMRKLWDSTKNERGQVPINWTISPALVDAGPALLNYFYTTATEMDCFVSGPSGLGYSMPINTSNSKTVPVYVDFLKDKDDLFEKYTKLTDSYLQRSGLRVVTVWDTMSAAERKIYADSARYLYGLTVHDWSGGSTAESSVESDRVLVQKLNPFYGGSKDDVLGIFRTAIRKWDGKSPLFIAGQVSVWGNVKPVDVIEIRDAFEKEFPGQVEFVRADHYYALYNEANGLPFNLNLSANTKVSSTDNDGALKLLTDGTSNTIWAATEKGEKTITFEFDKEYSVNRYVIRHAGDNGLDVTLNSKDFIIEISKDGSSWNAVDNQKGNTSNVTDVDIESVSAKYLRIKITDAGSDGTARIADVEIYGKVS